MPKYNEWDALFYLVWYQPSHINLAYSLAQKIPKDHNPLLSGRGHLRVVDFGCGALAMQLALVIAETEARLKGNATISLETISIDESIPMETLGQRVLDLFRKRFLEKTMEDRHLSVERRQSESGPERRWVTAIHVAYETNAKEVKRELDDLVEDESPDLILVTKNSNNPAPLYSPSGSSYRDMAGIRLVDGRLHHREERVLQGTTALRKQIAGYPGVERPGLLRTNTTWDNKIRESLNQYAVRKELQ